MKLFSQLKSLIADFKEISALLKQLQQQQAILTEQLKHVQTIGEEIQTDIDKMNFKNQPHLDRIAKSQQNIDHELSKYKAR
ncbi:hypothetical protein N2F28_01780 [Leuconostoc falkenbergense]|jgi:gas vesicle protein|uniref:Uncharacterized protein n=1 Tax=Leuconostoc falkenbergense TaxID=2766470 RepID=A0A9X3EE20_9LACO|nr:MULTISPECIES: hypothetical protein [Leuconostoc]RDG20298.1 hypothetical protein DQM11_01815 [Leuconostoc pseudomesenteroides]MCT4378679.1 hypothetical protein [Leuconostoc falkenbergense]MCT4390015.1 hypothetical protein [Leuconostoc falkenbergense]MCT4411274.1 hypothetical protein [Leuconostoc falkenbergense]MCX7579153.1 hypothetical protein [Leuconostoc falkenbergense]